jgi:hypothetical protein
VVNIEAIHKLVLLLVGLIGALATTVVKAQSTFEPGVEFPGVWLMTGQSARVNALNLGSAASTQESGCGVTLQFRDSRGQVVKQNLVVLQPRKAASLELSRSELLEKGPGAQVRAAVLFGYHGGAPLGVGALQRFDCNIVTSLEVFDDTTGKISQVLTDAKPLPTPDERAQ